MIRSGGRRPALTSERYGDAFDQVKSLGIAGSTTATADEALTGRFWNGAIQNYWNEIAQTASVAQNLTTAENARLFALLSLSIADGVIAFYDAKYIYNFWRPVTAIRAQSTLKHLLVRPPGYSRSPPPVHAAPADIGARSLSRSPPSPAHD